MRAQTIADRDLVRQYIIGNEDALETLIVRHKTKVFTSIMMYVKDTVIAEDIFQDTFIKVVETLRKGKYKEEGKFLPWVMRISYNLCIDYFRKVKRTPTITNSDGNDIFNVLRFSNPSVEDDMIKRQTYDKVKALVDKLPVEQREVVMLRHYAELSFKEISAMTGVSINTALGRMRYALINMRKIAGDRNYFS